MNPALQRKLVVVTGKGGVGKSTVASAIAAANAASGRRTLLARADPHDRVWKLFDFQPSSPDDEVENANDAIASIAAGLDLVDIRPEAALREYGSLVLRSKRLYTAVFENRVTASFMRGTPGIHAWAILGKVCFHVNQNMVGGSRAANVAEYDRVVFDAPATGHMIDMIRVPIVIQRTASAGPLRRGAEGALQVLSDPEQCTWLVVSTAEPLALRESEELAGALRKELPKQSPSALLNQTHPLTLGADLGGIVSELSTRAASQGYASLLARVARRENEQRHALETLRNTFDTTLLMPTSEAPILASTLANFLKNSDHT